MLYRWFRMAAVFSSFAAGCVPFTEGLTPIVGEEEQECPDTVEMCDGVDNDCDAVIDEELAVDATTWFADFDGDGYGEIENPLRACNQPERYVEDSTDCDDSEPDANPGADEVCDGFDNDCDGQTDEPGADNAPLWYSDEDGDGYGDPESGAIACSRPMGYTNEDNATDCDDAIASVNPDAEEVCDLLDNDCDGWTDEGFEGGCETPEPSETPIDSTESPTQIEVTETEVEASETPEEASPTLIVVEETETDETESESPTPLSTPIPDANQDKDADGFTPNEGDCDDTSAAVNPDANELCSDGIDNDCDGQINEPDAVDTSVWYLDVDQDGYGLTSETTVACYPPTGYTNLSGDCDETNSNIHPNAEEVCDGKDNDCDSEIDEPSAVDAKTWYEDVDEDGFGNAGVTSNSCTKPQGFVSNDDDCDDTSASVTDGIASFPDEDNDGFGDSDSSGVYQCTIPAGFVGNDDDCNDGDATIYPNAGELCNGVDDDCDGVINEQGAEDERTWYIDSDGDNYGSTTSTREYCDQPKGYVANANDCDDADANIHPKAPEYCNGVDDNCDGRVDESAVDALTFYDDEDSDDYGDDCVSSDSCSAAIACSAPEGFVANDDDCDDEDAEVNPDELEYEFNTTTRVIVDKCSDLVDNNCDKKPDSYDALCQDEDLDGIKNGADAFLRYDRDANGSFESFCVVSSYVMEAPWSGKDAVYQSMGVFTMVNSANTVDRAVIEIGGDSVSAFCRNLSAAAEQDYYERLISLTSEDGSSPVETENCEDWVVMDVNAFCGTFPDAFCKSSGDSNSCGVVGWLYGFKWNGVNVSPI